MKRFNTLKALLCLLIILFSIPFTLLEEMYKGVVTGLHKVRLNYQLMMYIKQL